MQNIRRRNLTTLVRPARDLPGVWVAHVLEWDLVTQGESLSHAIQMGVEAVVLAMDLAMEDGRDPFEHPSAPDEDFQLARRIMSCGKAMLPAEAEEQARTSPSVFVTHIAAWTTMPNVADEPILPMPVASPVRRPDPATVIPITYELPETVACA